MAVRVASRRLQRLQLRQKTSAERYEYYLLEERGGQDCDKGPAVPTLRAQQPTKTDVAGSGTIVRGSAKYCGEGALGASLIPGSRPLQHDPAALASKPG